MVPACPARPRSSAQIRLCPAIASTTPGRRPQCFKDRALLDVDLEVTEQSPGRISRLVDPRRIEPERAKRVGHGDPGRVGPLQQSAIESAGGRQAAQKRSAITHAFFLAERDHVDAKRQATPAQGLHGRQAEQDPEHSVVLAGIGHGVQVRADRKDRPLRSQPVVTADQVAGGIEPNAQAGLFHPLGQSPVQPAHRLAEKGARDPARFLREQRDLVATREHFGGQVDLGVGFLRSFNHQEVSLRNRGVVQKQVTARFNSMQSKTFRVSTEFRANEAEERCGAIRCRTRGSSWASGPRPDLLAGDFRRSRDRASGACLTS